jgi:hypothetical protein
VYSFHTFANSAGLELRSSVHNVDHQAPGSRGRVHVAIEHDDCPALALGPVEQPGEVFSATGEPVDLGSNEHIGVATVQAIESVEQGRTVADLPPAHPSVHDMVYMGPATLCDYCGKAVSLIAQ